jgi:3-methylfumaryl-CoA hydratase
MQSSPLIEWIGRTFESEDVLTDRLVRSFRATMEPYLAPCEAGLAPLGCHWLLFPTEETNAGLGTDGHPKRFSYLPPPPLPRRMWAGGELELLEPLRIGDRVQRRTTIEDIQHKSGSSGELCFVTVIHEFRSPRGVAIRERQDIVYRAAVTSDSKAADKKKAASSETKIPVVWRVETPTTLLFRYSAIIFISHRIHYDLPYATEIEGYEGLVVHGPLQATLLLNASSITMGATPKNFQYRGISPAIAGRTLDVCVEPAVNGRSYTRSADGIHMVGNSKAEAAF